MGDHRFGIAEPLGERASGTAGRDGMPLLGDARDDRRDDERAEARTETVLVDADSEALHRAH